MQSEFFCRILFPVLPPSSQSLEVFSEDFQESDLDIDEDVERYSFILLMSSIRFNNFPK